MPVVLSPMRLRAELIAVALLGSSAVASEMFTGPARPVSVYITWAAHDELSDTVKLDQALAERQLAEAARLKSDGVQLDYFLLDMGWFDPAGGFRSFRADRWPGGPDPFFAACARQGLKPGLWLLTNVCGWNDSPFLKPQPEGADLERHFVEHGRDRCVRIEYGPPRHDHVFG